MLTPEQIQAIADTMFPMLDELNAWITRDMIRRFLARLGRGEGAILTASDEWQLQVSQEAGGHLEAVQRAMRRFTELSEEEIARVFEDAAIKSLEADNRVYLASGGRELVLSAAMMRVLEDAYRRTNGTIHNLTRTTAAASQRRLIQILDEAHLKVMTGAQSYAAAVSDALKDLAGTQAEVIYPTGHVDTLETAVLRAVRTGTAQAAGNMSIQGMIEHDWDLIRVSAHIGARYGDGGENPGNHFWWQGKLYSRTGRDKKYPPFVETTGYGTGEGLCGWNCRHSFGPGDPNHNPFKDFDAEENRRVYDLSRKQRKMERNIRHTKNKLIALREGIDAADDAGVKANLEAEYSRVSKLLGRQNQAYNDFCKDNGLKRLPDRLQTARWSREDARRSIMAAAGKMEITHNLMVEIPEKSDIMERKLENEGFPVKYIGKIDTQIYSCVTSDSLVTDDVIITEERISHIHDRHPGDYEMIRPFLREALENPDYILENRGRQNTALILKEIRTESLRFQLVLRLLTSADNPDFKNSIISAWRISESRWNNYLKNKKILYKRPSP